MFWAYILKLNNGKYYVGQTSNLNERIERHRTGQTVYTRKYRPIELVWSEVFATRSLALKREKYLKSLKSHQELDRIISLDGDGLIV